ncbi:UDP-N-acetylmuramate dehydrogenase [Candidatus Saccharibacteria bacterium]|nr:UDP-N-acetylmuramate dehydrogenase [Candidatus Saccharibacteria bacterium]
MRVNENILISSLTTMRLGGPARYVIEIEAPTEIPEAYNFARQSQLPTFVLGYGANTLGHDDGFNGVIIINRMRGITEQDGKIKIMGGEYWDNVVEYAASKGLTGIEAMSKIPGLAGGAPVQNIGAYGQDISDTFLEAEAYDSVTGAFMTLSKSDLRFSYRKSILNTIAKNRFFIISITLALRPGQMLRPFYNSIEKYIDANDITDFSPQSIRNIVSTIRADKLPDPLVSASSGSFFHNVYLDESQAEIASDKGYPVIHGKDGFKINSGWLIEQCGFKGKLLYGIRISSRAALVLINESAESYNDLAKARSEIVGKVYDKFGYWLEQEPVEIGQ